ncbi:MAG: hypothetical protein ACJ8E9_08325 [Sphingomicrobium sp.]
MKPRFLAAASAFALLSLPAAAMAQHAGHPGMSMPMPQPEQKPQAPAPKPEAAPAEEHMHEQHAVERPPAPAPEPMDHGAMDHGAHQMAMTGALGRYPMAREASGTSWQPDASEHGGLHLMSGDWTLMAHGELNLVHSWQEKPRGDSKSFVAGMLMGMARRPIGNGTFQFKAMVSPDPLMGKRGYPLLLASGETADGEEPLIDRQHPHDFFMELSASISQSIGPKTSLFAYAGLPGEPAFGPPAFMHRQSISASPEAPISHHWLDSTHISFGVLTAGLIHDGFKLEASRFNGREPDQHRWNIETAPLDSTSIRLSWNPTSTLALQGSWAHLEDPEQLEPGVDQKRWSASGTYTRPMANGWWSTTLAWGRKHIEGEEFDAFALESSVNWKDWTLFGRGEMTENNELVEGEAGHHGEAERVGKVSVGLVRDFRIAPQLKLGLGGLYAFNFVPDDIEPIYGGNPNGAMAFIRLKLD